MNRPCPLSARELYDLVPKGYGSTYEMDDLPELDIMENVTCEEREPFVDENTTVKTWIAKNTTGVVVAKREGTFTRIEEAPVEENGQIGILVIGHGSTSDSWCAPVRSVVANVSSPYPVELGFLEFVPNETINIAVDKGDVKKEEKKAFKLLWEELKEKLMYKPVDYLFEDVNKS